MITRLKRIIHRLLPYRIKATLSVWRILSRDYGHYVSAREWCCVAADRSPLPWYTYPAIEYIKQLDLRDKRIFEFGSGNSTLFWAARSKSVVSVEDNKEWYEKIAASAPSNVSFHYLGSRSEYVNFIKTLDDKFDVVIVDGSFRRECARAAVDRLADDGFIILDNADWREKTAEFLRSCDLIEVDMSGFSPINSYTLTTSFFFSRNVSLKPLHSTQPVHSIGSMSHTEPDEE